MHLPRALLCWGGFLVSAPFLLFGNTLPVVLRSAIGRQLQGTRLRSR